MGSPWFRVRREVELGAPLSEAALGSPWFRVQCEVEFHLRGCFSFGTDDLTQTAPGICRLFLKARSGGCLAAAGCGEHGGDPDSVKFFHKVGLNYVSCSPFRVPGARLAAAQAAIEEKRAAAAKAKKK